MSSRKKLLIYNIIVAAICIAVLVSFFIAPFWKVEVSYTVTPQMAKELVEKSGAGSGGSDNGSSDGSLDSDDVMSNLNLSEEDYEKVLGKKGLTISVSIQLVTTDLFASLAGGEKAGREAVEKLINTNVSAIVGGLVPKISKLVKNALPVVSKVVISQAITSQLDKALEDSGNAEIKQALEDAGLTDEFIEEKTQVLVDAIFEEGATVDSISDTVAATVEEVFVKMQSSNNSDINGVEFTDETKKQIRDQVKETLSMLADEDGKINADDFISDLIVKALQQGNGDSTEGGSPSEGGEKQEEFEKSGVNKVAVPLADTDEDLTSAEKLEAELTKFVMDKVDDSTVQMLSYVMMGLSGFILFTMFTWLYLIIKILVKLACKNPGIKLALPIWLGWLPFLLLVLAPSIALSVLKSNPGAIPGGAEIVSQLSAIGISFSSCTIVAFIGAILLFVLFFFYRRPRKKLKKLKKLRKTNPEATEADV